MKKILDKDKLEKILEICLIVCTLIISLLIIGWIVLNKVRVCDYFPINGDFQTYNMVRRLLDGQIPFNDFFPYLGLGPLFLNSIICFLTNNYSLYMSMASTLIISVIVFILFIYSILRIFKVKRSVALLVSVILIAILSSNLNLSSSIILRSIINSINSLLYSNNSLRNHRAFSLIICLMIFRLLFKKIDFKTFNIKDFKYKHVVLCGAIIGIFTSWSNDYGIPIFLSAIFLFIVILVSFKKDFFIKLVVFIVSALASVFATVSILTLGNFKNWVLYNFKGVAGDQPWYFSPYGNKSLILWEFVIDFKFLVMAISIIILVGLLVLFWAQKSFRTKKNISIIFLISTSLLAGYLYSRTNSNDGFYILEIIILICSIIWSLEFIYKHLLKNILGKNALVPYISYVSLFLVVIILFALNLNKFVKSYELYKDKTDLTYVEQVGGYISNTLYNDLSSMQNLIGNEKYFSTYAAMLEVLDNKYHPTKVDYIIHALGDELRNEYINEFKNGDYKYAITINPNKTGWEIWSIRANYTFHKYLIMNYKPVLSTSYYIVWEKQDPITIEPYDITYEISKMSDYQTKVDFKINNFEELTDNHKYIDVDVSYVTNKMNNIKSLGTIKNIIVVIDSYSKVLIENASNSDKYYGISIENNAVNLPVYVAEDGTGFFTFNCFPLGTCTFDIEEIKINGLLPYYYDY